MKRVINETGSGHGCSGGSRGRRRSHSSISNGARRERSGRVVVGSNRRDRQIGNGRVSDSRIIERRVVGSAHDGHAGDSENVDHRSHVAAERYKLASRRKEADGVVLCTNLCKIKAVRYVSAIICGPR